MTGSDGRPLVAAIILLASTALGCTDKGEPPGAPRLEVLQAPPAVVLPGAELPDVVTVRATDADGTPVAGVRVTWSGDGVVAPLAETTDADGLVSARWTLPRLGENPWTADPPAGPPGTFTLRASLDGEPAVVFTTDARAFSVERIDVGQREAACGIRERTLWCWGVGIGRVIPLPAGSDGLRPFAVPAAGEVSDVAINDVAACVLDAAGRVSCIGEGSPSAFLAVPGAPPLRRLFDGPFETCGLAAADSTAWCWSWADGTVRPAASPSGALRFARLAIGESFTPGDRFTCGLDGEGLAWCWGGNRLGQLGDGTTDSRSTPAPVAGGRRYSSLAAAYNGACGLSDGEAWCWGEGSLAAPASVPTRSSLPRGAWTGLEGGDVIYAFGLREARFLMSGLVLELEPIVTAFPLRQFASTGNEACLLLVSGEAYCTLSLMAGTNISTIPLDLFTAVPSPMD